MKKICYIISDIDRVLMFEWISQALTKDHKVYFILLNNRKSVFEDFLKQNNFDFTTVRVNGKRDWLKGMRILYRTLRREKPDIVHCHFFEANILGLVTSRLAGVKQRIYTRHFSSLHHVYFRKGILWDKLCNRLATKIVAISNVVCRILVQLEKVPEEKIVKIPHALLEDFAAVSEDRVNAIRRKYQIPENAFVVGVISRLTEWKGVQYVIPAFRQFLESEPNAVLLLLNAHGNYEKQIHQLLKTVPPDAVRLVKFENDIVAAYKTMNAFVHVPIDDHSEAFGLTYIEALAAQIPSIFTMSGIAPEFIVDEKNALVVPYKNSEAIHQALLRLCRDRDLETRMTRQGAIDVRDNFSFSLMMSRLNNLYAAL